MFFCSSSYYSNFYPLHVWLERGKQEERDEMAEDYDEIVKYRVTSDFASLATTLVKMKSNGHFSMKIYKLWTEK